MSGTFELRGPLGDVGGERGAVGVIRRQGCAEDPRPTDPGGPGMTTNHVEQGRDHRPLVVGVALSPVWLSADAWRREDSRVEEMFSLSPYRELVEKAERAVVDFLFCPEAGHLEPSTIRHSPGFATLESFTLVTALAAVTRRIGLVPTVQTAFANPFTVARQLASLHRISGGRAGWNVVTALAGERNHGLTELPDSAERHARADEFITVVEALWRSFPSEAFVADRGTGVFADPDRVQAIDFDGKYFKVAGPMALPQHPAGRLPVVQAGASPAGIAFAGARADLVFGAVPDLDAARGQRAALRSAAVTAGRDPGAIRFLPGLHLVLAETREQARRVAEENAGNRRLHWSVSEPRRTRSRRS
ncbi:LLM class flavin-dependent oxidoreductase [Arachnia propionica]|uniref:LLM class flavin-dependent oxidoreductase n=2 Tax=Arachnia propionica TaxID=1750 RepID=A0A3P1TBR0_9ACTN|nr:LLM class flavin-dependent oxidoreductase [Arachnia propionica]